MNAQNSFFYVKIGLWILTTNSTKQLSFVKVLVARLGKENEWLT